MLGAWGLSEQANALFNNFNSPINDKLEAEDPPTLEELLDEDEIIQEARMMNTLLIEYLATEETASRMISYMIEPISEEEEREFEQQAAKIAEGGAPRVGDDDDEGDASSQLQHVRDVAEELREKRWLKYPVVSCEVLCCDIPALHDLILGSSFSPQPS